jgi:polysaccharide export outer membrane protein
MGNPSIGSRTGRGRLAAGWASSESNSRYEGLAHVHRAILIAAVAACLAAPVVGQAQKREPAPAVSGDSDYRLGPEDVLDIQVWGRPDLKGSVTVDSAGRIQVPLLGEMRVEGRSPAELARDLTERYQLLDPSVPEVLVSVTAYNSHKVTVLGEVRTPGQYGFRVMPDLWGAIYAAGGPGPAADLSRVQLIRDNPEHGASRTALVDLSRGIEGTAAESLPALHAKDKIIVPSTAGASVGPGTFHVLGAVRTPGPYRITAASTVVEALSISGGALSGAELRKVHLTRTTPNGVVSYQLDIEGYLTAGKPLANLGLQPGDTITVPEGQSGRGLLSRLERLLPLVSLAVTVVIATRTH